MGGQTVTGKLTLAGPVKVISDVAVTGLVGTDVKVDLSEQAVDLHLQTRSFGKSSLNLICLHLLLSHRQKNFYEFCIRHFSTCLHSDSGSNILPVRFLGVGLGLISFLEVVVFCLWYGISPQH